MKLGEVCTIISGIVKERVRTDQAESSSVRVLNPKNVSDNRIFINGLEYLEISKKVNGKFFTKRHDIIMKIQQPHDAVCIEEEIGILVPASFYILRDIKGIHPKLLTFLLNSDKIKSYFLKNSEGGAVKSIKIEDLRRIRIPKFENIDIQRKKEQLLSLQYEKINLISRKLELESKKFKYCIKSIGG